MKKSAKEIPSLDQLQTELARVRYRSRYRSALRSTICTLIVAVLGPTLGAFADTKGFKKPLFLGFVLTGSWQRFGCRFCRFTAAP